MAPLRVFAHFVPYVAVLVGIHCLSNAWAAILLYHAGMLLFGGALSGFRVARLLSGFSWWAVPAVLLGLTSGPALLLVLALPVTDPARPFQLGPALDGLGLRGAGWVGFMAAYTLVNPWLEEWYWREVLATPSPGVSASDLAFAGYHAVVLVRFLPPGPALLLAASLVPVAWAWRQWSRRAGGTLLPALMHLAADASIIWAANQLRV